MSLSLNNSGYIVLFTGLLLVKYIGPNYDISLFGICPLFGAFVVAAENRRLFVNKGYNVFTIIFLIYMSISLLWSDAPSYGGRKLFILSVFVILALLSARLFVVNRARLLRFMGIIFGTLTILLLLADYNVLIENTYSAVHRYRISDDSSSSTIACFFGFCVILFFYNFKAERGVVKIFFFISGVIVMFLLIYNGNRGSLIALFVSSLAFKFFDLRLKLSLFSKLLIIICAFIFIIQAGNLSALLINNSYLNYRYFTEDSYASVEERGYLFATAFNGLFDTPFTTLFGHGIGSFGYRVTGADTSVYPHNSFLEISYELGLIYLGIILGVYVKLFKRIRFLKKAGRLDFDIVATANITLYLLLFSFTSGDLSDNFIAFIFTIYLIESLRNKGYVRE